MKFNRRTLSTIITVVAGLVLLAALPSAIVDTFETGRIYLFSHQFLEELPQRFTGPGRMRFILQPAVAVFLGIRGGRLDAQMGRSPYLYALLTGADDRRALLRSGLAAVRDLVSMSIVFDVVAQFLIYGRVYPGAAVVLGPVLICLPYSVARALTLRVMRLLR
ncbi:hypothetical protein ACQ858_12395 [Variovorax ureilyticus]|uniref:hypothetical protein n=1 Tax=Variovorax ureilyticus TaxID=1836198 RepID=UPI003D6707EF